MGESHTHKFITRLEKGGIDCKVCRGSGICLHVDTPDFWVYVKSLESALDAEILNLVYHFITAIITTAWVAFRVLVG